MVRQAHHPEQTRRVILKFQYTMTKTFSAVVSHLFAPLGLPELVPLHPTMKGPLVWPFEFEQGLQSLEKESELGAARFTKGAGRHGNFETPDGEI